MADPLRRTLLAKLRGKKSKKGTTAGGCGVAANGGREGKEKVLQKRDGQTHQAVMIAELDCMSDKMRGNESYFNGGYDNKVVGLLRENTVVFENAFAQHDEATLHINTRRGDIQLSGGPGFGGRDNAELLGVSVQRDILDRGSDRDEMIRFYKQEPYFSRQVQHGALREPQEQKKQRVPIPRQHTGGDSIGFGSCENIYFNSRRVATDRGAVKLTDGRYPASKNNGTNVCCEKDLKIHCDGGVLGQQAGPHAGCVKSVAYKKEQTNFHSDHNRLLETNVTTNGTQMYHSDVPRFYHYVDSNVEENNLIRTIESYGSSPEFAGEIRVPNLQSPTFFPTELEICDVNVAAVCAREGALHHSLDSEDDDYYDNEILPFYESQSQNVDLHRPNIKTTDEVDVTKSMQSGSAHVLRPEQKDSAQETDRLRSQLKEAYYLLINAMHDLSFDSQVGVNGFVEQTSTSSHSHDSVCSHTSAKHLDSDAWSSGEHSPQQMSDTDSLLLNLSENCVPCLKTSLISKSSVNLTATKIRPPLQRSVSDGAMKYPTAHSICVPGSQSVVVVRGDEANQLAGAVLFAKPTAYDGTSSDDPLQDHGDDGRLNESSGSANSLTSSSDNADAQGGEQNAGHGGSAKPHGVTVNKMQEWMHKGRMLSSEMRQRIAGSSLLTHGPPSSRPAQGVPGWTKAVTQTSRAQGGKSASPCPGAHQSALIENAHSSREPTGVRAPLNTITVSKKRNWLQQSSGPPSAGAEDERGPPPRPPPSPSPEGLPAPSRPPRLPPPRAGLSRRPDPAEENDADDEGEIWYNPIPEDEEPDPPRPAQRRPSGGGAEGGGEGPGAEAGHAEPPQLLRQMLACRAQEDGLLPAPRAAAADGSEQPTPGFSPPSSPNPSKKGSSLNWSFPDKIKSPRTVRKLSMKMKKLPELSRKLSVKGTPSGSGSSQSETRVHSPKANGPAEPGSAPPGLSPGAGGGPVAAFTSGNVISRYHLDSSVSTQHSYSKKKSGGASKSASKGGYLSDGDSPELVAKSGKHGSSAESKAGKAKEKEPAAGGGGGGASSPKLPGTELDIDAFRPYSFTEQPKCTQYISGLMSLHFYGAEDLKPPRVDSRDVYCAIQVDSVNKARTALLTCRTAFLDMDHTFNIELENAQHLKLVVFSWEATPRRHRVCCHGTVALPALFRVTRTHQLAVRLEPRGMIYVKLGLMEKWQNSLDGPDGEREPHVFGVEAWRVVEREGAGLVVPLLIEKCITEIEKRGCQVVGLYRLCGSAAVKKELREAFERDSHGVELSENQYPDINVITGVLKDYLRELPYPLITKQLYEAVLVSMATRPLRIGAGGCENDSADTEHTVGLLENLPEVEKATLRKLLNHLKLVASHHEVNKMTCQNLAVCFGPVLLSQRQDASCHSNRVFIDSEELASALHFKKHIEVLHYLLQLWPVVDPHGKTSSPAMGPPAPASAPLRRRKERPQVLNLSEAEMAGVLRPRPGRLDSPSNRYAGDWSGCRETLQLPQEEADYDDVPSEEMECVEEGAEEGEDGGRAAVPEPRRGEEEKMEGPGPAEREEESETERAAEEAEESGSLGGEQQQPAEEPIPCDHILPACQEHRPKEHTYQAYMKIQEISPVLSNRVNLRDLQESIDALIGNLERELNKNKLNVGY